MYLKICETHTFMFEFKRKHEGICRKVANSKRKVFDSGRQRAANSDVPYKATKKTQQVYVYTLVNYLYDSVLSYLDLQW